VCLVMVCVREKFVLGNCLCGERGVCVMYWFVGENFVSARYWFVGESGVCVRYYFVGEIRLCVLFTGLWAREFCLC